MTKYIKYIILTITALILLLAQPVIAAEPANGKIEGMLINKTKGSSGAVANQKVVMQVVNNNKIVTTQTTLSTGDGKFIFEGLSTDSTNLYEFGVTYQEVDYYSLPVQFKSGETAKSTEIAVYNVTTSNEKISVMMSHAILSFTNNTLNMKEYFLVTNTSDLTFIGQNPSNPAAKRETLKFYLPEGAGNFKSNFGLTNYRIDGTTIYDSDPVSPGSREVSFSYVISVNADKYTLLLKVNYATNRFDLLLQDKNVKVAGAKLTEEASLSITGQTYRDYSSNNLVPGDSITVQLSALPSSIKSNTSNWALLAFIPVILVIIIGFWLLKRKKSQTVTVQVGKESLLAEIAELDDLYEEKKINQEDYLKLRTQKKQQVMALVEAEKGKH